MMTLPDKHDIDHKHYSLIFVVVVAVASLALGVFLSPVVGLGLSGLFETSSEAISGAMVLSAAVILVFVIARYGELLARSYFAGKDLEGRADAAERALSSAKSSLLSVEREVERIRTARKRESG